MKITRRQLREMILEEVDPSPSSQADDQPQERVHKYFVQRAKKISGVGGKIALALAEAYMEGKATKDEVMKAMINIEQDVRKGGLLKGLIRHLGKIK